MLTPVERALLNNCVANHGRYSIHGLPLAGMVDAVRLVLGMEAAGLVNSKVHYLPGSEPDLIVIEITDAGRRALAEE